MANDDDDDFNFIEAMKMMHLMAGEPQRLNDEALETLFIETKGMITIIENKQKMEKEILDTLQQAVKSFEAEILKRNPITKND